MLMRISLGVKEKKSCCQEILPEREWKKKEKKLSFLVTLTTFPNKKSQCISYIFYFKYGIIIGPNVFW